MLSRLSNITNAQVGLILGLLAFIGLLISGVSHIQAGEVNWWTWADGAFQNFSTEVIGAILTFGLIEVLLGSRKTREEVLILYKTGRTNANDGGIDFVMKPLGRFFQVTETIDVSKYFLDIDKVLHYLITFVVKSSDSSDEIRESIQTQAKQRYPVKSIVAKYMFAIEEIINIPHLTQILTEQVEIGNISLIVEEILIHSTLEFHFVDDSQG